jgi:hypothetical protein
MSDRQAPERRVQDNQADERVRAEQDELDQLDEPIESTAYGASSAESGGNYDQAGPTAANIEGEPMDADETTSDEPSPS